MSREVATLRREIHAACAAAFPGLEWSIRRTEVRGRGKYLDVGFSVSDIYGDRLVSFVTAAPIRSPGLMFLEATEVRPRAATPRAVVAAVRASLRCAERLCDATMRLHAEVVGAAAPLDAKPAPTPPDARAVLGDGAFYAYYDCGVGERIDGRPRPTREGPEGDAMRVGWDEEDRRQAARSKMPRLSTLADVALAHPNPLSTAEGERLMALGWSVAEVLAMDPEIARERIRLRATPKRDLIRDEDGKPVTSRQAGRNARRWGHPREAETLAFDEAEWLAGWDEQDARLALAEDCDDAGAPAGEPCARQTVRERVRMQVLRMSAMSDAAIGDWLGFVGTHDAGRGIGDEDCEGEPDTCGRSYDHGYEQAMRGEICECGRAPGHSGPCGRPERCGDEDDGAPDAAGESGGLP